MNITSEAIDFIKSKLPFESSTEHQSYNAGYDCGKNGATLSNCSFTLFGSPAHTAAWNEGKADAEAGRQNKYTITSDGAQNRT